MNKSSVLKTVWMEAISLTNHLPLPDEEYRALCDRIDGLENQLTKDFTPEQAALFEELSSCWEKRALEEMLGHFILGVRFGGQCVHEVFWSD